jgi:hypothetical protein
MKKQVTDIYEQIQGNSTGLGNLLSKIPGLSGYMERGRRRDADQLLRETIAARLERIRLQFSSVHQELSRDIVRAMQYAEGLGRVDTRLMGLIGKIKDAPQGYGSFFDAIKVKEDDLARIYIFDENMLNYADTIEVQTAALEKAVRDDGDVQSALRELDLTLREANQTFSERDEVIKGISL